MKWISTLLVLAVFAGVVRSDTGLICTTVFLWLFKTSIHATTDTNAEKGWIGRSVCAVALNMLYRKGREPLVNFRCFICGTNHFFSSENMLKTVNLSGCVCTKHTRKQGNAAWCTKRNPRQIQSQLESHKINCKRRIYRGESRRRTPENTKGAQLELQPAQHDR